MSHTRVRSLSNQRDHLNHINFVVQKASLHFPPKLHIRFALYPASNWLRTAGALDSCACWEYISEWGGVRFPLLSPRRPGMVVALNSQVFYTIRLSENGPLFRMEGATETHTAQAGPFRKFLLTVALLGYRRTLPYQRPSPSFHCSKDSVAQSRKLQRGSNRFLTEFEKNSISLADGFSEHTEFINKPDTLPTGHSFARRL